MVNIYLCSLLSVVTKIFHKETGMSMIISIIVLVLIFIMVSAIPAQAIPIADLSIVICHRIVRDLF